MECLLIGGAQSVGKSETIYRLAQRLIRAGFGIIAGTLPIPFSDFRVVLEGSNKYGKKIKIIINSPTDTDIIINDFKVFFDSNGGSYDILISSVRDDDFWPRPQFFSIMNISTPKDFILEIPLGKITRRGLNFPVALAWYQQQNDFLIDHTLSNTPFDI
ncbi:hypothetical protein AM493_05415 [Flavobacterium akiainvivens]|uniref:NadR/Ttd14 AAA domain-containing protein n=1 Tax=Flavobacterium akiainvivens TaxID=1202724 RepID=A0A0M8M879_9FLAO|nr:hypothetical protein [Flavobacterium akiainvivens]KOS05533.1 hypothetical protein AM493_05415 [Flavobacterium akiainvivens]SFQ33774.1 hypothetical protein SAMN05444144_103118 [Flavobacterium akiainvivens]